MDQDSLLSSNWPLHIGSYNREKKLIRDVSYKSEKFRSHFNYKNDQNQGRPNPNI